MKIIAIDPGIEKVGYAFLEQKNNGHVRMKYVCSGLIKTKRSLEQHERLKHIDDQLKTLLSLHKPDHLVIEQLFFFKNAKTVISVAQAQGVIVCAAAQYDISVSYITPLQIKQAITGYGSADKKAVHKMITMQLDESFTVADDDESDAIACGMAYLYCI
jgi:crossover junction endodeoxyribonuclease RuvC